MAHSQQLDLFTQPSPYIKPEKPNPENAFVDLVSFKQLKNVKNTHGGVLLLEKLQALKVSLLHGCCSRFFDLHKL